MSNNNIKEDWNGHNSSTWASIAVKQQNTSNTRKRKQIKLEIQKYEKEQISKQRKIIAIKNQVTNMIDIDIALRCLKQLGRVELLEFIEEYKLISGEWIDMANVKLKTNSLLRVFIGIKIPDEFIIEKMKILKIDHKLNKFNENLEKKLLYEISKLMMQKGIAFTFLPFTPTGTSDVPYVLNNKESIQFVLDGKINHPIISNHPAYINSPINVPNLLCVKIKIKFSKFQVNTQIQQYVESHDTTVDCYFSSIDHRWHSEVYFDRIISYKSFCDEYFLKSLFLGMEITVQFESTKHKNILGIIYNVSIEEGTFDVDFNESIERFYFYEESKEIVYKNHFDGFDDYQIFSTTYTRNIFNKDAEERYDLKQPKVNEFKIIKFLDLNQVYQFRKDYDYYMLKHLSETSLSIFDGISGILDIIACYIG